MLLKLKNIKNALAHNLTNTFTIEDHISNEETLFSEAHTFLQSSTTLRESRATSVP